FRADMARLVEDVQQALQAAFESKDFHRRQASIEEDFTSRQDEAFEDIKAQARRYDIAVIRTPAGVVMAPLQDDEVVGPAQFHTLPQNERESFEARLQELQQELEATLLDLPEWERRRRGRIHALQEEIARKAVHQIIEETRQRYEDVEGVLSYLDAVEESIVTNSDEFVQARQDEVARLSPEHLLNMSFQKSPMEPDRYHRYQVNVLVTHDEDEGAPVVQETYPTLENLIGRIDHQSHLSALTTDFTLIKAGALHRANGGYLILDIPTVLMQPLAWEQLKRALRAGEIRIESPSQILGLVSTVSLEPEAIPLDVKVVLIGERVLYYLLYELDPDFRDLFKVPVDFDDRMERGGHCSNQYARLIATVVAEHDLLAFDKSGVARVIEHSARLARDSEKLTTHMENITDLLRESHFFARREGKEKVGADDVEEAINAQERRLSRIRDLFIEETTRGTYFIDADGEATGQINGLSVM
ncbi:MAG: AAA family ATPase, partial [Bradymonadaceae bacterium]